MDHGWSAARRWMLHAGAGALVVLALVSAQVRPTLEFAALAALAWSIPLVLAGLVLHRLRTGPGGWVAIATILATIASVWLTGRVVEIPVMLIAGGIGGIALLVTGAVLLEMVRELRVRMSLAMLATMVLGGALARMQVDGIMVGPDHLEHVALLVVLAVIAVGLGSPRPEPRRARRRQLRAM